MFVTCKIPSALPVSESNIRFIKAAFYKLILYPPTCVHLWLATLSLQPLAVGVAAKINHVWWLVLQHKRGLVSNLEQFDRSKRRKWKKSFGDASLFGQYMADIIFRLLVRMYEPLRIQVYRHHGRIQPSLVYYRWNSDLDLNSNFLGLLCPSGQIPINLKLFVCGRWGLRLTHWRMIANCFVRKVDAAGCDNHESISRLALLRTSSSKFDSAVCMTLFWAWIPQPAR